MRQGGRAWFFLQCGWEICIIIFTGFFKVLLYNKNIFFIYKFGGLLNGRTK
jgi:hypothetical protein